MGLGGNFLSSRLRLLMAWKCVLADRIVLKSLITSEDLNAPTAQRSPQ